MKANIQITQVEFKVDTLEWSVRFYTPAGNDLLIPVTADKAAEIVRNGPPYTIEKHQNSVYYLFV